MIYYCSNFNLLLLLLKYLFKMLKNLALITFLICSITAYKFKDILSQVELDLTNFEYTNKDKTSSIKLVKAYKFETSVEEGVTWLGFKILLKIKSPDGEVQNKYNGAVII
jgi:hypothetical protein